MQGYPAHEGHGSHPSGSARVTTALGGGEYFYGLVGATRIWLGSADERCYEGGQREEDQQRLDDDRDRQEIVTEPEGEVRKFDQNE